MEHFNIQFTAHLTENHQLKAADALISKLQYQLGQANSYIEELEDKIQREDRERIINLENELEAAKLQIKKLEFNLSTAGVDERVEKRNKRIKELELENKKLKESRDLLLVKLIKLEQHD